jgi:hypothetical protein
MRTEIKYVSDICGFDIVFMTDTKCRVFEAKISNLNTYIGFGKKYDELVEGLEHSQYSNMRAGFVDKFLEEFKHFQLSSYSPEFRATIQFMLKFVKEHEKDIKKYTDNKLQYVEAIYSSSHDCHDEHEYYAFPENYTRDEIMDYLQECAQSWYDGMGYGEDDCEDDYIEDEGPDYSYEVHPLEEVMKYGNFTEYTIA